MKTEKRHFISWTYYIVLLKMAPTTNNNNGEESMDDDSIFSEERFNEIISGIDQEDWILANVARLVYYAGFHKNEIENIKIGNVRQTGAVVSEIEPFLPETRKAYSKKPIILNDESKKIIKDHINKLNKCGYYVNDDNPLFPNNKTKIDYVPKTLKRNFEKYFGKITFDDLRANGINRQREHLEGKHISNSQRLEELKIFSRHSRSSTTKKLIVGDVQKAGKSQKKDLPWESIVRSIERLPLEVKKEETFRIYLKNIQNRISAIEEIGVRESLNQLLNEYYSFP
jgi:hypothetical protein